MIELEADSKAEDRVHLHIDYLRDKEKGGAILWKISGKVLCSV